MYDLEKMLLEFMAIAYEMADCHECRHCRQICPSKSNMDMVNPPFPDFIGRKYSGLVIIGANPGTSHDERFKRQDIRFNELFKKFKATNSAESYAALLDYRNTASLEWDKTLCASKYRTLLGYDFESVAFVNIVKCRTLRPGSTVEQNVGFDIARLCAEKYLLKQLAILKPRFIVCQWKPIKSSLSALGYRFQGVERIGSYSGQRNLPEHLRTHEIVPIFNIFRTTVTHTVQ